MHLIFTYSKLGNSFDLLLFLSVKYEFTFVDIDIDLFTYSHIKIKKEEKKVFHTGRNENDVLNCLSIMTN